MRYKGARIFSSKPQEPSKSCKKGNYVIFAVLNAFSGLRIVPELEKDKAERRETTGMF